MTETSGRILKSDYVELEGQYYLDLPQDGSNGVALAKGCKVGQKAAMAAEPQAQVVEELPDHAVIEVTCSCGTKVRLKCQYAANPMPENS